MSSFKSILHDLWTVARRELGLVFRGRRGVLLSLATLVLAALPAIARSVGSAGPDAAQLQQAQIAILAKLFSHDVVRALIDCPPAVTVCVVVTFFFQPVFVLLVGADAVAGDVESGTMRFWTVRGSRVGILLGKALGLWLTVCTLTLLAHAVAWVAASVAPEHDLAGVWRWGPKLYLLTCAAAFAQVSIVILFGTLSRHPRRVLAGGIVVLAMVRVGRGMLENRGFALGSWLPGAIDNRLLSPQTRVCIGGLALVLGWSVVCLASATAIFGRRDA